MRRFGFLLVLLLVGAPPNAAPQGAPPKTGSLIDLISEASVRGHMEFLAGDALNGRGSGTRDEWLAAAYIGSQLRRWGVEPLGDDGGYVQTVTVSRGTLTAPPTLAAGRLVFTHGQEMLVDVMGSGGLSGPLIRLKPGQSAPAGSIALLPEGAASGAATDKAAATLLVETANQRARWPALGARLPVLPVSLATQAKATPSRQLRIVVARDAYAALGMLNDGMPITFNAGVNATNSATYNAVGRLTGSDPVRAGEVILLTAHLDHLGVRGNAGDRIYNGADDDASGTTAVLELAEALAKGPRPKRTVIFAWFGSEEAGGYGASAFLASPPAPLDRIVANLEFEMIGRPDGAVAPHTLWLTGYERSTLGPALAEHGARLVADPHPEQGFFFRSDNIQLARTGVVAQTVSSFGLHADYHRPSDDLSKIDFAHMTESIQSLLDPVLWLANSTFRPEWAPGGKP